LLRRAIATTSCAEAAGERSAAGAGSEHSLWRRATAPPAAAVAGLAIFCTFLIKLRARLAFFCTFLIKLRARALGAAAPFADAAGNTDAAQATHF
jgi:hypothetical protein